MTVYAASSASPPPARMGAHDFLRYHSEIVPSTSSSDGESGFWSSAGYDFKEPAQLGSFLFFILAVCFPRMALGQAAKAESQTTLVENLFLAIHGLSRLYRKGPHHQSCAKTTFYFFIFHRYTSFSQNLYLFRLARFSKQIINGKSNNMKPIAPDKIRRSF